MQEAPDLSKIVSVIMQNPTLISEIASLMKTNEAEEVKEALAETSQKDESTEPASVSPKREAPTHNRQRRKELLNAMKPYLSEQRRGAIDSMASILDILDVMGKRESQ